MRKKGYTQIAEHGPFDDAVHIGAARDFLSVNMYLADKAVSVRNRCAVDDAIELRPESVSHAHRTRLARGIHRITRQEGLFQFLAGEADGAGFAVSARIVLRHYRVRPDHQTLARLRVDDKRAERHGAGSLQRPGCEFIDLAHAFFV